MFECKEAVYFETLSVDPEMTKNLEFGQVLQGLQGHFWVLDLAKHFYKKESLLKGAKGRDSFPHMAFILGGKGWA